MKLLIIITAIAGTLGIVGPALAGQTCVTRNGYIYCGETYGDNQNCIKEGSNIICY